MASRLAGAALLLLALFPGRAVGIQELVFKVEGEKSEISASEGEASEKPTKLITAVLQPLTPFGEPVVGEAASKKSDSEKEDKARTPSLLTMQVDDQKQHTYDSKHSYVHGGPPLNKNGDTFDIPLKSQI